MEDTLNANRRPFHVVIDSDTQNIPLGGSGPSGSRKMDAQEHRDVTGQDRVSG